MNKRINIRLLCSVLVIVLAVSLIIGCAGKKPSWGDANTGFILAYKLDKDQTWKYDNKTTQVQAMEMMGNAMETTTDVASVYSITGQGLNDKKHISSNVKMESASIEVKTPMGDQEFDLSALIGKDFGLTFGPCGKQIAFLNPDNIEIDFIQGAKRSADSFFKNLLPRLAQQPVKIGGTWTVSEKDTMNEGGMDIFIDSKTLNTVDGIEKVGDIECLKITSK